MSISSSIKKCPYKGGTHEYKRYYEIDGQRLIASCSRIYAHLQSCGITNPTGSIALRYIMIDIDADRSHSKWKDSEGALDWQKIHTHLSSKLSKIYNAIEYVTRSYSKKGIHLIFGFSALPLDDSTRRMQGACIQSQNYIIKILNDSGLGADEGARGLNRHFSTFRNTDNILHQNKILTKRIENDRSKTDKNDKTPYILNLLKACKKIAKDLELTDCYRLYNHSKVEVKIAKLYLYTLGLRSIEPMMKLNKNLKAEVIHEFKRCLPHENITLTLKQIEHISGLTKKSLKDLNFFNRDEILNLWDIDHNLDGSVTLSAKNVSTIAKRILRASRVLAGFKVVNKIDPRLIEPCLVQDGERNFAICSWVLSYKWAGCEENDALEMVKSLVKAIPGYEFSRSCKESQVAAVVRSIYKYKEELTGIKGEALPQFMWDVASEKIRIKFGHEKRGRNPGGLSSTTTKHKGNKLNLKIQNVLKINSELSLINAKKFAIEDIQKIYIDENLSKSNIVKISSVNIGRKDGFACYEGKFYSLGLKYYGCNIKVTDDQEFVYFYSSALLIAKHKKIISKSKKYSINENHKLTWDEIKENNCGFLYRAKKIGLDCRDYISAYLSMCEGFVDNRYLCGILALKDKFSSVILNKACGIALENRNFSSKYLRKIALDLSIKID
jgi:hypothetical protein